MNLPMLTSLRTITLCSACLLLAATTVQASELDFAEPNSNEININLFYETLKDTLPSLFAFKRSDEYFGVDKNKSEYFTLRLNKKEKFKASYESGSYFINYSRNW